MLTLVMAGSESPAFLRHGAQALAEALPHARLLTRIGPGSVLRGITNSRFADRAQ